MTACKRFFKAFKAPRALILRACAMCRLRRGTGKACPPFTMAQGLI